MEKIKELLKTFLSWAGTDGLLHISVSALILLFFAGFLPVFVAIILTLAIGVAKEIVWDKIMDKGCAEAKDLECDIIGIVIGLLVYCLYLI